MYSVWMGEGCGGVGNEAVDEDSVPGSKVVSVKMLQGRIYGGMGVEVGMLCVGD